ncbi:MAG: hypothetical protein Q8P10_00035 [bacterium]|nr:hypothetical protein [bacterium]
MPSQKETGFNPENISNIPRLREAIKEISKEHGLVILISGGVGTGTTTLTESIGKALKLTFHTINNRGAKFRHDTEKPVVGFVPRDPNADREFDKRTKRSISRTKPGQIKIIEARLATFLAVKGQESALAEGKNYPDIFAILIHADEKDKVARAFPRDSKLYPDLQLTAEMEKVYISQREDGDMNIFRLAHPGELEGILPWSPNDEWARKHHDLILNSSACNPTQEVISAFEGIVKKFANKEDPQAQAQAQAQIPPQGDIFKQDHAAA